uniref:Uncharacterized protein n=1 Tax=Arundo donax TaxID=35708 RepID=A0A0A9FI22_ARUDO
MLPPRLMRPPLPSSSVTSVLPIKPKQKQSKRSLLHSTPFTSPRSYHCHVFGRPPSNTTALQVKLKTIHFTLLELLVCLGLFLFLWLLVLGRVVEQPPTEIRGSLLLPVLETRRLRVQRAFGREWRQCAAVLELAAPRACR